MQTTIPTEAAIAIAVTVPILSALIGVGGVLISQRMTNNREKNQRAHQREMKEKELEEAKQQRLRDDRIKAYLELAKITSTLNIREKFKTSDLIEAYTAVALVGGSKEARRTARDLYEKHAKLRELARYADHEEIEGGRTLVVDENVKAARQDSIDAWLDFIMAAREDIGHSADETGAPDIFTYIT